MQSLENQFLIAMPSLADDYFNKTVTYICEHNDEGAMGLIINMPVNITLHDLLKQIEENEGEDTSKDENALAQISSSEQEDSAATIEKMTLAHSLEQFN